VIGASILFNEKNDEYPPSTNMLDIFIYGYPVSLYPPVQATTEPKTVHYYDGLKLMICLEASLVQ
jgi:hypothetical protein